MATRRPFWKWHLWPVTTNNIQILRNPIWPPIRPFWKWHCWKLISLGLGFQSQTKVRVRKPKKSKLLPGSHFESNAIENQLASAHSRKQQAYEIKNWNSKANFSFVYRRSDRWTEGRVDERTRLIQCTPHPTTPTTKNKNNSFWRGYKNNKASHDWPYKMETTGDRWMPFTRCH